MADPFSGSTAGGIVVVGGISMASLFSGIDGNALVGAFAGAAVFVLRAQDLGIARRLIYFAISMAMGYLAVPEIVRWSTVSTPAVAAFIASAATVTIMNRALDWLTAMTFGEFVETLVGWWTRWRGPK